MKVSTNTLKINSKKLVFLYDYILSASQKNINYPYYFVIIYCELFDQKQNLLRTLISTLKARAWHTKPLPCPRPQNDPNNHNFTSFNECAPQRINFQFASEKQNAILLCFVCFFLVGEGRGLRGYISKLFHCGGFPCQ